MNNSLLTIWSQMDINIDLIETLTDVIRKYLAEIWLIQFEHMRP